MEALRAKPGLTSATEAKRFEAIRSSGPAPVRMRDTPDPTATWRRNIAQKSGTAPRGLILSLIHISEPTRLALI
eukprot:13163041-Alexandrium_andersonii.AAC.1